MYWYAVVAVILHWPVCAVRGGSHRKSVCDRFAFRMNTKHTKKIGFKLDASLEELWELWNIAVIAADWLAHLPSGTIRQLLNRKGRREFSY